MFILYLWYKNLDNMYIYIHWLVVLTILKNMKVNGKDDIPYMKWTITSMFQTTNQISWNYIYIYILYIYIYISYTYIYYIHISYIYIIYIYHIYIYIIYIHISYIYIIYIYHIYIYIYIIQYILYHR